MEELDLLNVTPWESKARVGLEFEQVIKRLSVQFRMGVLQFIQHQQYALEQAVLTDAPAKPVHNRGCCPIRGVHWYTSP